MYEGMRVELQIGGQRACCGSGVDAKSSRADRLEAEEVLGMMQSEVG